MSPKVFLASRNPKKLAELRRILDERIPGVAVLGLDDVAPYEEPVEDADSFTANALLKARAAVAATGLPSLADDSGLCVAALNQMPGVLSARWSGLPRSDQRNNQLLLDQLHDVPEPRRGAAFQCAIAFCWPEPNGTVGELVVEGQMPGLIIREQRGAGGFGYDVVFVPDQQQGNRTSAEMTATEKDAISHRGQALREIAPQVVRVLAGLD